MDPTHIMPDTTHDQQMAAVTREVQALADTLEAAVRRGSRSALTVAVSLHDVPDDVFDHLAAEHQITPQTFMHRGQPLRYLTLNRVPLHACTAGDAA